MAKKKYEINKEIKPVGIFLNAFMPNASKGFFRFGRKTLEILYKGKKNKNYNCNQIYLGKNGTIRTCVYSRKNRENKKAPAILWIHGGGYGMGIPEFEFSYIEDFLSVSDCVVISPDYTLSYKEGYPVALNECYEVLLWIKNNAESLGVDENMIIVGGDSAGGGLTVALSLYARDKGEVKIAMQIPIYPMIEDRDTATNFENSAPMWNSVSNERAWKIYLKEQYRADNTPYYAVPNRCEDFSNMPPTVTYVGDIDLFLDETKQMIKKLDDAGVYTAILVLKGCYHGFDQVAPKSGVAREARAFLKQQFLKFLNGEIK